MHFLLIIMMAIAVVSSAKCGPSCASKGERGYNRIMINHVVEIKEIMKRMDGKLGAGIEKSQTGIGMSIFSTFCYGISCKLQLQLTLFVFFIQVLNIRSYPGPFRNVSTHCILIQELVTAIRQDKSYKCYLQSSLFIDFIE